MRRVVAAAEFQVLPGRWAFGEAPLDRPPRLDPGVLAVVRDEDSWSWLAPASGAEPEVFALFSLHFPDRQDNSGFVGWLAAGLKAHLGTGVFVVCGQNSARGGIYDYWGCPAVLADGARSVVEGLRAAGSAA